MPTDLSPESVTEGVEYQSDSWEKLQRVIEDETLSMLPAGGFACLIEPDGQVLCHPEIRHTPSYRDVSFAGLELRESIEADSGVDVIDAGGDPVSGVVDFGAGNTHFVATRPLGNTGLRLVVHQPVGALVAAGEESTGYIAGVASVMALLVLGVTAAGLSYLLRRYDSVYEALNTEMKAGLETARKIQQSSAAEFVARAARVRRRGLEPAG